MTHRTARPFLLAAFAAASALAAFGPAAPARAQDDAADARAIDGDLDRLRNNPFLAGDPDRVRKLVLSLLERHAPRADTAVREMLLDPRTNANVVEQICAITLVAEPHTLLDDVVERLRIDGSAAIETRLDAGFLHADMDVVRRLVELSRDTSRTVGYRRTAVRLLGRTGDGSALATLADLWGGPERELRDDARAAFEAIAPAVAASPEEARAFVERLRREDLPLVEALRRRLRELSRPDPVPSGGGVVGDDYRALALEMLPRATLDQILRLYVLASPSPEVRAAAVKRLASYRYDDAAEPDGRVRAARTLFQALRREDVSSVELAILGTLQVLAPSVRGNVATEDMDAVLVRVRPPGAGRPTRLVAVRLLRELRDERSVAVLEAAYVDLGDGDVEMRLAVLDALQEVPADRTSWTAERLRGERHPEVLRKLVLLLGRSRDPAAVSAFAALLGGSDAVASDVRRDAASALATQWAAVQSAAARDALLEAGRSDKDAGVRAIAAGALGIAGPGREATLAALLAMVRKDTDPDVRRAAARSVVLLDEPRATQNLMGRFAEDAVVFEVVRDHLLDAARSDQSPDALLLASATLVTGGLRPFAVQLLDAASRDVLTEPRGRAKVLASLARCLLDEGRPADALPIARSLVADAKDDAARDRAELLLCSALTASGEADRLAEAEPRLVALRAAKRLDAASEFEAAATLGDCLLRRDDALAALAVLDVDAEGAAAPVRLRITTLRQDALARVARDRAAVLALVAALGGPGGDDARARLWAMSGRAAFHVSRELETASDPADIRRLLAAAAVVTGGEAAPLPADASAERVAAAVAAARRALAAVPIDAKRPER